MPANSRNKLDGNRCISQIAEKCLECGQCSEQCPFLSDSGQSPAMMARRGIEVQEAYSCSLCGACETACPQSLSPKTMFAERRHQAVAQAEIDIDEYRYLFPDRKNNIMNVYRSYYGIDYSDLTCRSNSGTWFFPGCTLLTYSPALTREIHRRLQDSCGCGGMWTECCGKPLAQLGVWSRAGAMYERLRAFLQQNKVNRVITACPGCYYELKKIFRPCDATIQTVYETLDFGPCATANKRSCTIHDACPDRYQGKFGRQVRQALLQGGFSLREMKHSQQHTICCGSGGQISHFRPDLTDRLVDMRLGEAEESGADVLAAYCLSCVLKFAGTSSKIPVTHVLNLLLAQSEDFKEGKQQAKRMLTGPEGEKIWEMIMTDDIDKGDRHCE